MTFTMNSDSGVEALSPSAGENLLLLMGLPAGCTVLAVGDRLDSWKGLFRNCVDSPNVPCQSNVNEPFGLVLYHSRSAATSKEFGSDMKKVREILAVNGSVLVFAENPTSFRNLRNLKHGNFSLLLGKICRGHINYEKKLQQADFSDVRRFYPLPGLEHADELVAVGSSLLELPHYWHPVLHAVKKIGSFRLLAEGSVFHASSFLLESGKLLSRVNDEVAQQSCLHGERCLLERIDIRSRGALVLFLMNKSTGDRLVARIVSDKRINEIVGKNHAFLESLHNISGTSEDFKKLIPRPLCRFEYSDSAIYVETMVEGQPAWKVNRGKLRGNIFLDAVGFLQQLNFATAHLRILQDHDLDELLKEDLSRIMRSNVIGPTFQEKVVHVVHNIRRRLMGLELHMTTSHGDYGYGNILVDPDSGKLRGVIDWDTARECDFPGVDLFNLLVQKERAERGCGPFDAFSYVINELASGGFNATLSIFRQETFDRAEVRNITMYLCFLRYVTRSLQYPPVFLEEQAEYDSILELLQDGMQL